MPAVDVAATVGLVGPDGTFEALGPPANDAAFPRVSPDGHTIAFRVARGPYVDVEFHDRLRGSTTKLTQDEIADGVAWHPDGRSLAIASHKKDAAGIFLKHLDGRERLLVATPVGVNLIRNAAWSPDGSKLAYTVQTGLRHDIWMLTMGDPPTTTPFLSRSASEHSPAFSPDGRWLAYASDESGRFEVYLQPYPTGERLAVSTGGGNGPVWRRDGKALFYQGLDGGVPKMMAVSVTPDRASLALGRPTALFEQRAQGGSGAAEQYQQSGNSGRGLRRPPGRTLRDGARRRPERQPRVRARAALVRGTEAARAGAVRRCRRTFATARVLRGDRGGRHRVILSMKSDY